MSMSPGVLAGRLAQDGHEVLVVLTCRDSNRLGFQASLLGLAAQGVEAVAVVRGTDPAYGDHPRAVAVADLDPAEALLAIRTLAAGRDLVGNPVEPAPRLTPGVEVDPFVAEDELKREVGAAERCVGAGARWLLTPPVHDADRFEAVIEPFAGLGVPIIARVVLLKSVGMARYLNRNVSGDQVPAETIRRLRKAPDKVEASVQVAAELIDRLADRCRGVCVQPLGWEDKLSTLVGRL